MMNKTEEKGMSLIVKTVTRLTIGFILLYGIYITLSGHSSPGGGFAGGVIIALSFVHIMLAFGKDVALKKLNSNILRLLMSAGGLVFLYILTVNFTGGCVNVNPFLAGAMACPLFNNEVIVPLCEMVIVGAGIFGIFVALVLISKIDRDSE